MNRHDNVKLFHKIHLNDLTKFDFVSLDTFGGMRISRGNGHHTVEVILDEYRDLIIDLVENNNDTKKIKR